MEKIKIYNQATTSDLLKACTAELINGKIAVLPTDTVYAIACDAKNIDAIKKIYKAKNRDINNPLNILVSSKEMAKRCIKSLDDISEKLIDNFWPGALTIVFDKNDYIPNIVTAGMDTIGIRMPEDNITTNIINMLGRPLAAPSANVSGKPSGTSIEDIVKDFGTNVDFYVDGGKSKIGIESTIVKVQKGKVYILRQGKITKKQIEALGIEVMEEYEDLKREHYKIKCKTVYINSYNCDKLKKYTKDFNKIALITFDEEFKNVNIPGDIDIYNLGSENHLEFAMNNIYGYLRDIESKNYEVCLILAIKLQNEAIKNILKQSSDEFI